MLQSVCAQLSYRLGVRRSYAGLVPADLKEEFFRLRSRATGRLAPDGRLVIAVDGLDELATEESRTLIQPDLFRTDAPNVRYVLSFRKGTIEPKVELGLTELETVALTGLDAGDVAELFRLLRRPDLAGSKTFLDDLVTKTAGEPFYLRFLAEDIAADPGPATITDDLPEDLQDYIARQVRGLNGAKLLALIPEHLRPQAMATADAAATILRVLVMAPDWLSRLQLQAILRGTDAGHSIMLGALIAALRRYFATERPKNPADELNERYLITPLRLRDGIRKAFAPDALCEAEARLLNYCRDWRLNSSPYAYNYLTHHLASAGAYDELIATIDRGFLEAKSAVSLGPQGVLPDIGRALAMALDRGDAPKIVRMMLMTAQVRHAIIDEVANGRIALLAAAKHYDLAIARAMSVSDHEVRYGQLLVVAEAALGNGDRAGLDALDRALALEATELLPDKAAALIDILLLRYRDADRALALAARTGINRDDLLRRAALDVIERDSAFAISLADRIGATYIRSATLQSCAEAVGATQPALAQQLIDKALEPHRGRGPSYRSLAAITVLRRINPAAARAKIAELMDAAQTAYAASAFDRVAAEDLNEVTTELANLDLPAALEAALTRCPEVHHSRFTKITTLTAILTLALEKGIRVDLAALPGSLPVPTQLFPVILDEYAAALAVHYVRQGDQGTAGQLTSQIKDDATSAAVAIWSCIGQDCDPRPLSRVLGRGRPVWYGVDFFKRGLRQLFTAKPHGTLAALALVADPMSRFDACRALLDLDCGHRSELIRIMTAAVVLMQAPDDRFKCALDSRRDFSALHSPRA